MTRNALLCALVLILFSVAVLRINGSSGTDLTASYLSCRVMQANENTHLYSYDPSDLSLVTDPVWFKHARDGGIPPNVVLAPFVQTPLWPFLLQPLCTQVSFRTFNLIFKVLLVACFCGLIWITGQVWAPRFFRPGWVLLLCLLWVRSDPMRDAMVLTQTHPLFLLLMLTAIVLATVRRPWAAGSALAFAAAVKITPGFLILYWLVVKRYRAALACVLGLVVLSAVTASIVGMAVTLAYLDTVSRWSNVLLLSANNQSLVAWQLQGRYPFSEVLHFHNLPLPGTWKVLSSLLLVLATLAGGWLDRSRAARRSDSPPYGAVFAIIGATLFAPIAWSHYYLFLVVPMILIWDEHLRRRSYLLVAVLVTLTLLLSHYLVFRQAEHVHLLIYNPVRGQLYAGLLAMASMVYLDWRRRDSTPSKGAWRQGPGQALQEP